MPFEKAISSATTRSLQFGSYLHLAANLAQWNRQLIDDIGGDKIIETLNLRQQLRLVVLQS